MVQTLSLSLSLSLSLLQPEQNHGAEIEKTEEYEEEEEQDVEEEEKQVEHEEMRCDDNWVAMTTEETDEDLKRRSFIEKLGEMNSTARGKNDTQKEVSYELLKTSYTQNG